MEKGTLSITTEVHPNHRGLGAENFGGGGIIVIENNGSQLRVADEVKLL